MTTVINNPGEQGGNQADGGIGVVVGAIIVVLVLVMAFVLVSPYIRAEIDAMASRSATQAPSTIKVDVTNIPIINTATTTN